MLHISLVGIGGAKIAEGNWHRSCKLLELFNLAHRSKPGLQIDLLHGSWKLSPQMSLDMLDPNPDGCVSLTVICGAAAQRRQLSSLRQAFAAIKDDGSVVSWGAAGVGGDSTPVADKLQEGVLQVVGNPLAFAAIKEDGSVVSWGSAVGGGDSSCVAGKLQKGVVQVFANPNAFAALKDDGSVVSWGNKHFGGNSSLVVDKLQQGV
ncbi:unnamed protein product, partial [Polarella glacialis]